MSDIEERVTRLERIAGAQGMDFAKYDTASQAEARAELDAAAQAAEKAEALRQATIAAYIKEQAEQAEAEADAERRAAAETEKEKE